MRPSAPNSTRFSPNQCSLTSPATANRASVMRWQAHPGEARNSIPAPNSGMSIGVRSTYPWPAGMLLDRQPREPRRL
jgi:hypothetical protein